MDPAIPKKRSSVRHGMASCARYGCTRPQCRRANTRAVAASHERVKAGLRATVESDAAREHANALTAAGMSAAAIAARAGLGTETVRNVQSGRVERIYRDTADAILGVEADAGIDPRDSDGLIDSLAARRRLQALTAIGHTLQTLASAIGSSTETLSCIRSGRRSCLRISLDQEIVSAYELLVDVDPLTLGASVNGSARARSYALRQGWRDPLFWEDMGSFADPSIDPDRFDREPTHIETAALRREEVRHLKTCGLSESEIASRLGISEGYVQSILRRLRATEAGLQVAV